MLNASEKDASTCPINYADLDNRTLRDCTLQYASNYKINFN